MNLPIFVVDDDEGIRKSLRRLLSIAGFRVEAHESADAFLAGYDGRAGCLVLDLSMPGMSGMDLLDIIVRRDLDLVVLVLTGKGTIDLAVRAIKAGAFEFLEKPIQEDMLIAHLNAALAHGRSRFARKSTRQDYEERLSMLTRRERETFDRIVLGFTSQEIAEEMRISKRTVDIHRGRVMEKMGATGVAELVRDWAGFKGR